MYYGYSKNKPVILKRLNRIGGQVRGVSKMIEEDKYCIDILTQIGAVKAAMDKVALELIKDHAEYCLSDEHSNSKKKANELADAIGRML